MKIELSFQEALDLLIELGATTENGTSYRDKQTPTLAKVRTRVRAALVQNDTSLTEEDSSPDA